MDRREFVSRVSLGAVAACTTLGKPASAVSLGLVNVRFVGMMGFIERTDRSFLVATPGQHAVDHMAHTPFLMARAGSRIATALGMAPAAGVVPAAFDTALVDSRAEEFVFRNLANTSVEVIAGNDDAVMNRASELGQMNRIAPGKRVRGNIEKWASATISLRGGELLNSSAHPDAGRVWFFGGYSQRLTDAVNFRSRAGASTSIRLTSATDVRTVKLRPGEQADLWMFSAVSPRTEAGDPTRIQHSELLFDYLVDAEPIIAKCPDATGRAVPPTELPFVMPTSASMGVVAAETRMPPLSDLCWMAAFLIGKPKG